MATSIHAHVKGHCTALRKRVQDRLPQYKRDHTELSQLLDVYDATLCTFCDSEDGEEMFAPLWTFYDPESCVTTPCLRPEFEQSCLTFIRETYQTANRKLFSKLWASKLLSDWPTALSYDVVSRIQDEQILNSHKRHVYCHQDGSLIKLWRKVLTVAPTALRELGKTIAKERSLPAPQSLTPEFIFNTVQCLIRKLNYNMHVSSDSKPDFAEMELDPVVLDEQLYFDSKILCSLVDNDVLARIQRDLTCALISHFAGYDYVPKAYIHVKCQQGSTSAEEPKGLRHCLDGPILHTDETDQPIESIHCTPPPWTTLLKLWTDMTDLQQKLSNCAAELKVDVHQFNQEYFRFSKPMRAVISHAVETYKHEREVNLRTVSAQQLRLTLDLLSTFLSTPRIPRLPGTPADAYMQMVLEESRVPINDDLDAQITQIESIFGKYGFVEVTGFSEEAQVAQKIVEELMTKVYYGEAERRLSKPSYWGRYAYDEGGQKQKPADSYCGVYLSPECFTEYEYGILVQLAKSIPGYVPNKTLEQG